MTWISHMLDYQVFEMRPGLHHLTNVWFHIANSLLLFFILNKMTGALWRCAIVAALFAVHPLHVESVAWVSERKDVLSTFFWMLTILAYLRYVKNPFFHNYLTILLLFSLGLMAKPMIVTLPFILLLLDHWPLNRFTYKQMLPANRQHRNSSFKILYEKIPLFFLSIASSLITVYAQKSGGAIGSLDEFPMLVRVANATVSYLGYIEKMIWPFDLAFLYPHSGWRQHGGLPGLGYS